MPRKYSKKSRTYTDRYGNKFYYKNNKKIYVRIWKPTYGKNLPPRYIRGGKKGKPDNRPDKKRPDDVYYKRRGRPGRPQTTGRRRKKQHSSYADKLREGMVGHDKSTINTFFEMFGQKKPFKGYKSLQDLVPKMFGWDGLYRHSKHSFY